MQSEPGGIRVGRMIDEMTASGERSTVKTLRAVLASRLESAAG
jgi:hypothetical protein